MMQSLSMGILANSPALSAAAASAGAAARAAAITAANGGTPVIIQVGTLIADDKGLDELDRRMGNRRALRGRGAMRYGDGQGGSFTALWTLIAQVAPDGTMVGPTLRSDIAGAGGDFAACNGVVDRAWVGGWAGSLAP